MKQKLLLGSVIIVIVSVICLALGSTPLLSSPPTNVKDVLDSSQLSYFARIGIGPTVGDSIITINMTAGTNPSSTTSNLFVGDTLGIGSSGAATGTTGPLNTYYIKDIGPSNVGTISLNTGIGQSNAFLGAAIIATRSAQHLIYWTPQSNLTGGFWQFLIKATSRTGEVFNDGIPDQQGFDIGATTLGNSTGTGARIRTTDVKCPDFGSGSNAFSIGTTVAVGANYYNVITCQLGAGMTNQVGVGYSVAIGLNSTSPELINPSAAISHTEGLADVYTFYVRHLDNGSNVVSADTMQGKIAVVESVRVTATIDPTISFQIGTSGISSGQVVCNNTLSSQANSVTADAVPFGSLLGAGYFNDLAQWLSCSTNSNNGYTVTVYEGNQMHNINDNVTIPDTTCDSGGCGVGTSGVWATDNTHSKWGFGMQKLTANFTPINITVGTTFYAQAFGNGSAASTVVMRNASTPLANETAWMCYRLTSSNAQEAGNYESKLVYTATATF
jgi:hypothetical protein